MHKRINSIDCKKEQIDWNWRNMKSLVIELGSFEKLRRANFDMFVSNGEWKQIGKIKLGDIIVPAATLYNCCRNIY